MTERTEAEIFEAYESERVALANAKAEIARLQGFRPTLLQTATVDEIIEIDDEIRLQTIAAEIAAARMKPLKFDLDMATRERAKWVGVDMPTDDELDKLLSIVTAAYPDLKLAREQGRFDIATRDHRDEFRRAFFAVGRMGRIAEPSPDRYFSAIVDDVNRVLNAHRHKAVEGDAAMCAILAWGDVAHRPADAAFGQLAEVALARINQGSPARPAAWRDLLSGKANLVAPLPPRGMHASSSTYPVPRVRITYPDSQEGSDGRMHEFHPAPHMSRH
jgi:hypothetical protein